MEKEVSERIIYSDEEDEEGEEEEDDYDEENNSFISKDDGYNPLNPGKKKNKALRSDPEDYWKAI